VWILRPHWPDIEAYIVGDGFYQKKLEEITAELDLSEFVTFAGKLDGEDLVAAFQSAAIVVIPSHHEAFGMVALEAMAAGTPVIASAVGGLTEYIQDGHTGLLTPPRDANKLADHINKLLKNPEYGQRLATAARKHVVPTYTAECLSLRLRRVYHEVLLEHS
jgi:glycosyltransferase involved in cell wall biosynthesis